MKKIILLILILFCVPFIVAHEESAPGPHTVENGHTVDEISQLEAAQDLVTNYRSDRSASIWPWEYFAEGRWFGGILAIVVWLAVLYTFGQLILLVIGRHL